MFTQANFPPDIGMATGFVQHVNMKLPRWLVISMIALSVLTVLIAAGWWWVTWPERTARQFTSLLAHGSVSEAKRMMIGDEVGGLAAGSDQFTPDYRAWLMGNPSAQSVTDLGLQLLPRAGSDVVFGRRRFAIVGVPYEFTAERGKVHWAWAGWSADVLSNTIAPTAGQPWSALPQSNPRQ